MDVFLDANILLELYQLSGPDLDELRKLIKLGSAGKLQLRISSQVADEFWRNRERVIKEALDAFARTKAEQTLPNIIRTNPKSIDLQKAVKAVNELAKELRKEVDAEIAEHKLKADEVLDELFNNFPPATIGEGVISRARLRRDLGNPPGKPGALGDAVNWEWLLDVCPNGDLVILSADNDFESELIKGAPREFLVKEWLSRKKGELHLFKTLPDFLKAFFPEIKLSDEVDKAVAVEALENSLSFAATHKAVARLQAFDDFSEIELSRLADAYRNNSQVRLIFGDDDVLAFAKKLVALASAKQAEHLVGPILLLLSQVKDEEVEDGDIPF